MALAALAALAALVALVALVATAVAISRRRVRSDAILVLGCQSADTRGKNGLAWMRDGCQGGACVVQAQALGVAHRSYHRTRAPSCTTHRPRRCSRAHRASRD
jgi:hypothetical protein